MYNKKFNDKRKKPFTKPTPIVLGKRFDHFPDGLQELMTCHNAINDLFKHCDLDLDSAQTRVLEVFAANQPSLIDKKNIHWTMSMSSNRVTVKTEDFIAFGWNVEYTVIDGAAVIDGVEFTFTIFNDNTDLADSIIADGWVKIEKNR